MVVAAQPVRQRLEHGISTGQLYTWRHALMASQPDAVTRASVRFAQVDVASRLVTHRSNAPGLAAQVEPAARSPGLIEITLPDGTTVRVDAQTDPRVLRRVLAAVRG
jgi:2-methylaconitate cis-trans-isomerase PrpF